MLRQRSTELIYENQKGERATEENGGKLVEGHYDLYERFVTQNDAGEVLYSAWECLLTRAPADFTMEMLHQAAKPDAPCSCDATVEGASAAG